MSSFANQICLEISKRCDGLHMIGSFGSHSPKEMDIIVVAAPDGELVETKRFESNLKLIRLSLETVLQDFTVKTSHLHHIASHDPLLPTVHLCYYENPSHLSMVEPPSFLAYLHNRGRFVTLETQTLSTAFLRFKMGSFESLNTHLTQCVRYFHLAESFYAYALLGHNDISASDIVEKISYAARFTWTEYIGHQSNLSENLFPWDWIDLFRMNFGPDSVIFDVFNAIERVRNCGSCASPDFVQQLFARYVDLYQIVISKVA